MSQGPVVNMDQLRTWLADLFVLPAKHRLPSPNRAGTQKHARIFHSYFLVLECGGKKPSNAEVSGLAPEGDKS